jgi:hypothetical protein
MYVVVACVNAIPYWIGCIAVLSMCGDFKELLAILTYT